MPIDWDVADWYAQPNFIIFVHLYNSFKVEDVFTYLSIAIFTVGHSAVTNKNQRQYKIRQLSSGEQVEIFNFCKYRHVNILELVRGRFIRSVSPKGPP